MKKVLALFLAILMCLSVFAGCTTPSEENGGATLEQAKEYLSSSMKEYNGRETMNDYDVVGKVIVDGVTFEVTWKTNNDKITVKASSKANFWTIDLPDLNETEVEYKLIATIKAADGKTIDVEFTPKLPAFDNRGVSTDLSEDVAYKIFFEQVNLGYTLYALNTTQDNNNKFINSTLDPKEAADFYAEKVQDGYKIYTMIDGTKYYLHATATPKESGSGYTKAIGFATTTECVFVYDAEISTYTVKIGSETFGVGTYNAFETISISEKSYFTAAKINVEGGQFPIAFMTSEYAETLTPDEKPVVNDPEADSTLTIAEAIALGETKVKDQYTSGKYYVTGTIKEVQNDVYGNIVITDGTNDILVYGTFDATGAIKYGEMENPPKAGDTVTVYGVIGMYSAAQIKNAWIVDVKKVVCEEHTYDNACDADCNACGETREPAAHVYDNACDAACNVCEAEREPAEHIYDNACDAKCNECEAERTPEAHKDDNTDAKCDVCGASVNAETIEKGRIDAEAAALEFKDVHVSGEYTLPAKGAQYDNVTITWTAEGATIANGKVTLSNATASDVTVTLKATFTCGSTTETKTYTFKVTAHAFDHACDADCNVENCTYTRQVADHNDANNDGKCDACGQRVASAPVAGVAYKLFVYQANNKKNLYFKGEMVSTYYFGTSENASEGVDIYFETVSGGYNMYFMLNGTKNYISVVASGSHINAVYGTTSTPSVYTYDKELDTMVTVVGEKTYFIGTYGTFDSISPSDTSKVDTNFISHYIRVEDASTCTHAYAASCAPKCYLCGTANPNPVHDYADATCTAPKTCETCKATTGEALGHNYVGGTCTNCGGAEPTLDISNATVVELDMMGTTNLQTATTSQTVYAANGITCTNDKADSTNDNYTSQGTYAARMYKGSTIKVEYTNIVKIVFVLDDYNNGQYLPGFDGMTVDGATIERVGDTVTILFNAPVNVFQSAGLGAQIRVETIKVYTLAN